YLYQRLIDRKLKFYSNKWDVKNKLMTFSFAVLQNELEFAESFDNITFNLAYKLFANIYEHINHVPNHDFIWYIYTCYSLVNKMMNDKSYMLGDLLTEPFYNFTSCETDIKHCGKFLTATELDVGDMCGWRIVDNLISYDAIY
ncbi:MAG: hypothetical protein Faunusvirus43_1, partial [Faunusvirus sp.]